MPRAGIYFLKETYETYQLSAVALCTDPNSNKLEERKKGTVNWDI